jgi:hypothetical protein
MGLQWSVVARTNDERLAIFDKATQKRVIVGLTVGNMNDAYANSTARLDALHALVPSL